MKPIDSTIQSFMTELSLKLEAAEVTRRTVNRYMAVNFSVFDLMRPDENKLSSIMAVLLDVNGSHGQGAVFLNLFLQTIRSCLTQPVQELISNTGDLKQVYTELSTVYIENNLRRIDICLDFGDRAIAIENKPWANDQIGQLSDYAESLKRKYGDRFILIYLTPYGGPPSEKSIKTDQWIEYCKLGKAGQISYAEDIYGWLDACILEAEAEKVRWFLKDFKGYIKRTFK